MREQLKQTRSNEGARLFFGYYSVLSKQKYDAATRLSDFTHGQAGPAKGVLTGGSPRYLPTYGAQYNMDPGQLQCMESSRHHELDGKEPFR